MPHRILLPLLMLASAAGADTKRLPITADVGICAHPKEVHLNTGSRRHVRIKGNEHYYLFGFDARRCRKTWIAPGRWARGFAAPVSSARY